MCCRTCGAPDSRPASSGEVTIILLHRINERLSHMATQADIDALTAQLTERDATLTTALTGIQGDVDTLKAEIAALQTGNPALNVAGLQAAVASIAGHVDQATAIDAQTPPPAAPAV